MLEHYFVRPETVDRIRSSWLGGAIEKYVTWLSEHAYKARCIHRRVPLLMAFSEFARQRGAERIELAADHLDAFVRARVRRRARPCRSKAAQRVFIEDIRGPIEQFLGVVCLAEPNPSGSSRPFASFAPHFFAYLRDERGLSPTTIEGYARQLVGFEQFAAGRRVVTAGAMSPVLIDAFLEECRTRVTPRSLGTTCAALRAFFRYLFQEGIAPRDLAATIDPPTRYSLSEVPRSISAADVERMLGIVDRRSLIGRRDYAMLLLLAAYGLRAREIAALTLDDFDWKASKLHVRARKAGHATVYPLLTEAGEAVLDYLRHGRPETTDRRIFFRTRAPIAPITHQIVSRQARTYLCKAGVAVTRAGSHTLRHSCAQRLVDAEFSLKVIGDFLGHRCTSSTRTYSKVAIDALREVALGDGEAVL
jgi:site-specific recombinase XerD